MDFRDRLVFQRNIVDCCLNIYNNNVEKRIEEKFVSVLETKIEIKEEFSLAKRALHITAKKKFQGGHSENKKIRASEL